MKSSRWRTWRLKRQTKLPCYLQVKALPDSNSTISNTLRAAPWLPPTHRMRWQHRRSGSTRMRRPHTLVSLDLPSMPMIHMLKLTVKHLATATVNIHNTSSTHLRTTLRLSDHIRHPRIHTVASHMGNSSSSSGNNNNNHRNTVTTLDGQEGGSPFHICLLPDHFCGIRTTLYVHQAVLYRTRSFILFLRHFLPSLWFALFRSTPVEEQSMVVRLYRYRGIT